MIYHMLNHQNSFSVLNSSGGMNTIPLKYITWCFDDDGEEHCLLEHVVHVP